MNLYFNNLSKRFKQRIVTVLPNKKFRGAGIIIFNKTGEKILLVLGRTHRKWSFPKGSVKNELESVQDCALRELHEETGLRDIKLHESLYFIDKDYVYFIAEPLDEIHVKFNIQDKKEICCVKWRHIDRIKEIHERKYCNTSVKAVLPR